MNEVDSMDMYIGGQKVESYQPQGRMPTCDYRGERPLLHQLLIELRLAGGVNNPDMHVRHAYDLVLLACASGDQGTMQ